MARITDRKTAFIQTEMAVVNPPHKVREEWTLIKSNGPKLMCWDEKEFPGRGRRSKGTGGSGLDRGASRRTCLSHTTQVSETCWAFTSITLGAGGTLTPLAQQGQPSQQLYLVPGAGVLREPTQPHGHCCR